MRPYNELRFAYNWHWFWDTGNGDIGNQGIHEMDMARWGMGAGLPTSVVSTGGKYVYVDDQETPNTQYASYNYGGSSEITFEVRGLPTNGEASIQLSGPNYVGDIFLGEKGFMSLDHKGFQIFLGDKREPGESGVAEKGVDTGPHMTNFLEAVRSRRKEDLHADVEEGVASVTLVHLANISYRLKRELEWDPATWSFKNDAEANGMRTRPEYRAPYIVPTIS
jgi:predicted dehydrogenase